MSAQLLVRVFYDELWNAWDDSRVAEVLDESFQFRGSLGQSTIGRDEWRSYRDSVRTASGDFHNEVVTVVAAEDQVAAPAPLQRYHAGPLLGIPGTGRHFKYDGAAFFVAAPTVGSCPPGFLEIYTTTPTTVPTMSGASPSTASGRVEVFVGSGASSERSGEDGHPPSCPDIGPFGSWRAVAAGLG
jgi:predicted ester cyclase